jgi:hypothetical protein
MCAHDAGSCGRHASITWCLLTVRLSVSLLAASCSWPEALQCWQQQAALSRRPAVNPALMQLQQQQQQQVVVQV